MLRRRAVLTGLVVAMPAAAAAAARAASQRPPKVTKAAAHYQAHPKAIQSCAVCTLFIAPHGCQAVAGKVQSDGWCSLFALVD